IPYVPRWSGTMAAEYGFTLPGRLEGFVRTEWRHAGRFRRAPSTRPTAYDPRVYAGEGSDLLFLRLGIGRDGWHLRSEEHTSELQSLMRNSYAVFCLNKK